MHTEWVGSEDGAGSGLGGRAGEGVEVPACGDGGEGEGGFEHGEGVADASAGAAAEGDESTPRRGGGVVG